MKTKYIDHLGDDLRVVNAARVSFNNESKWEADHSVRQELSDKDKKLIKYLANNNHFTPFTHPIITLRETVPIFVARQRFKHVVGFTYNEVSRRYVTDDREYFCPDTWRKVIDTCEYHYKQLLKEGVCPEQARMVLPQCLYTSYYVTGSLAAWARAYQLRVDKHAQREIQILAEEWNKIIEPLFPVSWNALTSALKS
jgi:thymidylate synthase (FAD)